MDCKCADCERREQEFLNKIKEYIKYCNKVEKEDILNKIVKLF